MQAQQSYLLNNLNTLRLSSVADLFVSLKSVNQLPEISQYIKTHDVRFFTLGGGSNLILPEHYHGLVIYNQLKGVKLIGQTDTHFLIKAMAGEVWDNFVEYTIKNKWYGLENLSLIPGTVGASPIQNIGAYGVEVKDFIDHVEVYDVNLGEFRIISHEECNFSYRNSMFKTNHNLIVTAVTFCLLKSVHLNISYGDVAKQVGEISNPTAMDLRNTIMGIRSSKLPDPNIIGNVGSFFHNPILDNSVVNSLRDQYAKLPVYAIDANHSKVSAGWLIDNLGLKGYRDGNIGVYDKQALVLVNHDKATKTELLAFASFIQEKVLGLYNIKINIEPIII